MDGGMVMMWTVMGVSVLLGVSVLAVMSARPKAAPAVDRRPAARSAARTRAR